MVGQEPTQPVEGVEQEGETNPIVVALASLIVPGLGQYFIGHELRGLLWFAGTAVFYLIVFVTFVFLIGAILMFFIPLIHLVAAADAYSLMSRALGRTTTGQ